MIEPDANGWMPIETAPENTAVMVIWPKQFGGWFQTAAEMREVAWYAVGGGVLGAPTHWQPLPLPPVQKA